MWNKVTIEGKAATTGEWKHLQDQFEYLFTAAGAPERAAMYTDREIDHAATVFYFSPDAAALMGDTLSDMGAIACARPASDAVTLLVGHDKARDTAAVT